MLLLIAIASFGACEKNYIDNEIPPEQTFNIDTKKIGEMHNALFDSLAYNWNKLNTGVSPSDSAVLYLLRICKKNYNLQVSNDLQKNILKFSKPYITNKLKSNKTFYETRKEIITSKLGNDALEFFFPTIDSLI